MNYEGTNLSKIRVNNKKPLVLRYNWDENTLKLFKIS